MKLHEKARHILGVLHAHGYSAFIVGGCVRDLLLNKIPTDWDITTNAKSSEIISVFAENKVIETGIQYGTVTVVLHGENFEVTTFRSGEVYTNHRKPDSVSFSDTITEDLSRRDFTINAMAYNKNDGLIDLFGGENHLLQKKIVCVGEAEVRFAEDALRILRALRFSSTLGFTIETKTVKAMREKMHLLEFVSHERTREEFVKILAGESAAFVLNEYRDIFCSIIPEISDMIAFNQHSKYHDFDVWQHTLSALSKAYNVVLSAPDTEILLVLFFHDIGKPQCFVLDKDGEGHFHAHERHSLEVAEQVLKRLKFDNETVKNVLLLIKYHGCYIDPDLKSVRRWMNRLGVVNFDKLTKVQLADKLGQKTEGNLPATNEYHMKQKFMHEITENGICFSLRDLAVDGNDILSLGICGKSVGETLNWALDEVIEQRSQNSKDDILSHIKKHRNK